LKRILSKALAVAILAAVVPSTPYPQSPPPSAFNDQGTFIISQAGRPMGTEKFSIRSSSNQILAQGEVTLLYEDSGRAVNIHTFPKLVLSSKLEPISYAWDEKSPDIYHLEVDFRSSPARSVLKKSNGKEDVRVFRLGLDLVILDNNIFHQYELLVRRYLASPGGIQAFNGFIPQEALPGGLAVADAGTAETKGRGKKKNLRHLIVTTNTLRVDLWVDNLGRLDRLLSPSAELEVVRKE